MAILQTVALVLFCGNMMAFLLDKPDAQDMSMHDEITFTPVATSESILFTADSINIRQCANEIIGWCSTDNDTEPAVHIVLPELKVIDTLTFDSTSIDCNRVPSSDMEWFTLQYLDPLDAAAQLRTYDMNISGPRLGDDGRMVYNLNPTLYTRMLKIIPSKSGTCFALKVSGSDGTGLCPNHTCTNGGQCIGANQCSCPRGFMGKTCKTQVTVDNIETNNFEFLTMKNGVIETPAVNFSASGNVTLHSVTRRRFLHTGHALGCLFHGVTGAIHELLGHGHNSLLQHINPFNGFTHSLHVRFGHGHSHNSLAYLFRCHPHSSHGVSASCSYANHQLHYHVNYGAYLYNMKVPFKPTPNHKYQVVLSFSLFHGLSIHVNGKLAGSLTKPSTNPSGPSSTNSTPGLCIGICGSPSTSPINMLVTNMVSTGLHLAGLTVNGLTHLLSPTSPSVTTPAATFTKAPATATTPHITTVSSNGPVCYNCSQQAVDGTCKTISKCTTGEVCALYQDANGYTHICLDEQVCSQAKLLAGATCWNCCSGSLCNDRCSSATKPCVDKPTCAVMRASGYNVCSNVNLADVHCRKTCHIC